MNEAGIFRLTAILDPSAVHADAKTYAAILLLLQLVNAVQTMGYIIMIMEIVYP